MIENNNSNNFESKKIFFLYPYTTEEELIIKHIVKNEFEAFQLNNHQNHNSLLKLLDEFNDSFVFINTDSRLNLNDWKLYINSILENPLTNNVKIGTLTAKEPDESFHQIFSELDFPCGKIKLKDEENNPINCILESLNKFNARGRRKYIRVICDNLTHSTFSIKYKKNIFQGKIKDISSVGMACTFETDMIIDSGFILEDLQLRLRENIVKLSGKVIGLREVNKEKNFIIMFDFQSAQKEKEKIHDFIFYVLQKNIMEKLKIIEKK